jgi:hypothetical protein
MVIVSLNGIDGLAFVMEMKWVFHDAVTDVLNI